MSRHVVYKINTVGTKDSTKRRYRDFLWLKGQLLRDYPGIVLPSLPPKGQSGDALDLRLCHLNEFMRCVATIPFMMDDPCLKGFLSTITGEQWLAYKNKMERKEWNDATDRGLGWKLWGELIDAQDEPDEREVEHLLTNLRHHIRGLCAKLNDMDTAWTGMAKWVEKAPTRVSVMLNPTREWSGFETMATRTGAAKDLKHLVNDDMASVGQAMSMLVEQWHMQTMHLRDMFQTELLGAVVTNIITARGMDEMLDRLDDYMREQHVLEESKVRRRSLFDFGSSPIEDEKEAVLDDDRSKRLAFLDMAISRITRSLVFCEVDRCGMVREAESHRALTNIAMAQRAFAKRNASHWKNMESTLNTVESKHQKEVESSTGGCILS